MPTNRNTGFTRSRTVLCLFLFIAAIAAVLGAISSSRATGQGGSASPEDDGKRIAGGARLGGEAAPFTQRVEGNSFHPVANKIAPWVIAQTANG